MTRTEHLDALAERGFNRLSMGVQDFAPEVQEAIGRVQSVDSTRTLLEHARTLGYRGINFDLIYGLPKQDPGSFEETLDRVLELRPDRIALYSFAYVPTGRGHQTRIDTSALPDPGTKLALFAAARSRFLEAGYIPIGMDHFARPDDELAHARLEGRLRRNFQGYTVVPANDVIGLGISAIGDLEGAYVQNVKKLSTYRERAGELATERGVLLTPDDTLRRAVIHDLMCNFRVDIPALESRFGITFATALGDGLQRLTAYQAESMISISDTELRVTPVGELFVRNLARCFDRYWWERHDEKDAERFSRTV